MLMRKVIAESQEHRRKQVRADNLVILRHRIDDTIWFFLLENSKRFMLFFRNQCEGQNLIISSLDKEAFDHAFRFLLEA